MPLLQVVRVELAAVTMAGIAVSSDRVIISQATPAELCPTFDAFGKHR